MAVVNTKSTEVTNADAGDGKMTAGDKIKTKNQTVETVATDSAGSVYRLLRVHSSIRPHSLQVGHDAITSMTTADIGVYDTAANGGAVVDIDLFGSAINMSSASSGMVERQLEDDNTDIDKIGKSLWEYLGLTSDPNKEYDLAITATTNAPTAAGTLAMRLQYHDGSK